jgi:formylglycine-generating enzyme required for sulfatase activity
MGSDGGLYADEAPVHRVALQPFQIGQFPVTNAEYALFMAAGGYDEDRWWDTEVGQAWRRGEGTDQGPKQQWRENRDLLKEWLKTDHISELLKQERITSKQASDWQQIAKMGDDEFERLLNDWYPSGRQAQPVMWDDTAFNNSAQPVVGVCWHEARAYCAWLAAQTGRPFRLPTEAEWEAAARGQEGRPYPYGPEFDATSSNTFESHIRRSTPIGVYPGGQTPEGLADMSGNTWDWTSSAYLPYPYRADQQRENPGLPDVRRRVARGGSWVDYRHAARCAYRNRNHPNNRNNNVGFRVVCAVSHVLPPSLARALAARAGGIPRQDTLAAQDARFQQCVGLATSSRRGEGEE